MAKKTIEFEFDQDIVDAVAVQQVATDAIQRVANRVINEKLVTIAVHPDVFARLVYDGVPFVMVTLDSE